MFRFFRKVIPNKVKADFREVRPSFLSSPPDITQGLPACSSAELLADCRDLVDELRESSGLDYPAFQMHLLPLIENYCNYVHLLPASERHHHREAGGLLIHGLETALWAGKISRNLIFNNGCAGNRNEQELRWRCACIAAGLLHDLGKPVTDFEVRSADGHFEWCPFCETLLSWLEHNHIHRYFVDFRTGRYRTHESLGIAALDLVMTRDLRAFLSCGFSRDILLALYSFLCGNDLSGKLAQTVLQADQESVKNALAKCHLTGKDMLSGLPGERYIFEAIIKLLGEGRWKVNEPGARVWVLNSGVYINWRCSGDITSMLRREKIPGVPQDSERLADLLFDRGYAEYNIQYGDNNQQQLRFHTIMPDVPGTCSFPALKITDGSLIFPRMMPPAIPDLLFPETCGSSSGTLEKLATGEEITGETVNQDRGTSSEYPVMSRENKESGSSEKAQVNHNHQEPPGQTFPSEDEDLSREPVQKDNKSSPVHQDLGGFSLNSLIPDPLPEEALRKNLPQENNNKDQSEQVSPSKTATPDLDIPMEQNGKDTAGIIKQDDKTEVPAVKGEGGKRLLALFAEFLEGRRSGCFYSNTRSVIINIPGMDCGKSDQELVKSLIKEKIITCQQDPWYRLAPRWSKYFLKQASDAQIPMVHVPLNFMSSVRLNKNVADLAPRSLSQITGPEKNDASAGAVFDPENFLPSCSSSENKNFSSAGSLPLAQVNTPETEQKFKTGSKQKQPLDHLSEIFSRLEEKITDGYFPSADCISGEESISHDDFRRFAEEYYPGVDYLQLLSLMGGDSCPGARNFRYQIGRITRCRS
ncbi:MAG: MobH family relaxase [Succinivibrionaceae bacterium]